MGFTSPEHMEKEESDVTPSDDRLLVKWLEGKNKNFQTEFATAKLYDLLGNATQPRQGSGNACIKLCFYIEQCRKSTSSRIQEVPFSPKTCLDLFNFFIEWSEKNQHRSMRQVLELIASLISINPQKEVTKSVKDLILTRIISILSHRSAQPLVKPAFKSLECFLSKGTISLQNLLEIYEMRSVSENYTSRTEMEELTRWDPLLSEIFDWLTLPDVAPAAGKCLVRLFGQLKRSSGDSQPPLIDHALSWQRWIRTGLIRNPDALENVKNYLFPPLFKQDRAGSLTLLEDLNRQKPMSQLQDQELSAHSLLQLAAIDVGKRSGLVEEPSTLQFQKHSKKAVKLVTLKENVIGPLLNNASDTVRSLAFSVLISSLSTICPFSKKALQYLQSHIGMLYADTDAKFRNEILSNTKHMLERLRGATAYLVRELQNLSFKPHKFLEKAQPRNHDIERISEVLESHEGFIRWYLEFLKGELIPTASYQRHITALKAINLLLKSGILRQTPGSKQSPTSGNETSWPFSIGFFTTGTMRLLLDLLMDSFEDVRNNASLILKLASKEDFEYGKPMNYAEVIDYESRLSGSIGRKSHSSFASSKANPPSVSSIYNKRPFGLLKDFISRADDISKRTGRADYADGLARCYALQYSLLTNTLDRLELVDQLIIDLQVKIAVARKELSRAVSDAPVHGIFAALNFVWESIDVSNDCRGTESPAHSEYRERWNKIQLRILLSCSSIWRSVKDVLCNDSPEGHLPEHLEEMATIDTKDVLSYSFRAIHESSNLMRTMASKIKENWHDGSPMLPTEVFLGIGDLTFEQLSNLRHRGAFSTVALTFTRCCQLAPQQHHDQSPVSDIIGIWYKNAMNCIFEQASTTRRSAGIPALITGILSSNAQSPSFEGVLAELIILAKQPSRLSDKDQTNLYQVHAMNCLKAIFNSSALGKRAESDIAECLQLAADSLNSEIWAIRNCGLLLLRSLIDCLFGTSESKSVTEAGWDGRSIRLFYDQYPSLPELLLKLLDTNTDGLAASTVPLISSVESVFPALDIIRRAGPPSTYREEIFNCVSVHLGSKIWHVREIAARTICTMMLHKNWLRDVLELISSIGQSTNRFHGILMAVRFILERRLRLDQTSATNGILDIDSALKRPNVQSFGYFRSPVIQAAYLEVYNTFAKIILDTSTTSSHPDSLVQVATQHIFTDHFFDDFTNMTNVYPELPKLSPDTKFILHSLLGNAVARRSVYLSVVTGDIALLQETLKYAAELNTDVALAAVDCVPKSWGRGSSLATITDFANAWLGLIGVSKSSEVCSAALYRLAEIIDSYFASPKLDLKPKYLSYDEISGFKFDITELESLAHGRMNTPSLSNAHIRISGATTLFKGLNIFITSHSQKPDTTFLKPWGELLAAAGAAHKDFETRHAAAAALATLYGNTYLNDIGGDENALPSLFALYDTLNDDDDEIRDLSAKTVSSVLGESLVPLAARGALANKIDLWHYDSLSYTWNVVRRMTGHSNYESFRFDQCHFISADEQFKKALENDDSLFVEEEHNLFVDEIRETQLWCRMFEERGLVRNSVAYTKRIWGLPDKLLVEWVLQGFGSLNQLLGDEDGPLGWSSKPAAFAICMRILLSANSILRRQEALDLEGGVRDATKERPLGDIVSAMKQFVELGRRERVHERLLFEAEGRVESSVYKLL